MKIINLTPHELNLHRGTEIETILSTTPPARVGTEKKVLGELNGYPVNLTTFLEVENMPAKEEGKVFVVSRIVAEALKNQGRTADVFIPDDVVRDEKGVIIGCCSFGKV
jgi:hypothetical protein